MKYSKYIPMAILCAISIKGLIVGFSYPQCFIIGLLGLVYSGLEVLDKYSMIEKYQKEFHLLQDQIKDIKLELDSLKSYISGVKLAQQQTFINKR